MRTWTKHPDAVYYGSSFVFVYLGERRARPLGLLGSM